MSDFFSDGWSVFVAVATIVSLVACLLLLIVAARRRVMADDDTTGHVWDGNLREMNNPLPRWWMVLFVLTVLFAFGYLVLYPGLGSRPGSWQWSSTGQYQAERASAQQQMAPLYARFAALSAEDLARDPQAMGVGERLFVNNCATCHGSDARGSKGFPDLTDEDWLHGGTFETVKETITNGRQGLMPPLGAAIGSAEDVRDLAHYVLSLSASPHDSTAAQLGRNKFATCAACHGANGKGNHALGAPNLTDRIWLHGWGEAAVVRMINQGKVNVMPAHHERLSPEQIHVLAAYVLHLGNARRTPAVAAAER